MAPPSSVKHDQAKYTKQKRMRRREQSLLLTQLDRLLPVEARRGGFKGCGHRSPGLLGRSVLQVLSDTIGHVIDLHARNMRKKNAGKMTAVSGQEPSQQSAPDYRSG